jgi:hypothetical protein
MRCMTQAKKGKDRSPGAARFLSQDPHGQEASGPNLSLYTADSPTNATDPYDTNLTPPNPSLRSPVRMTKSIP